MPQRATITGCILEGSSLTSAPCAAWFASRAKSRVMRSYSCSSLRAGFRSISAMYLCFFISPRWLDALKVSGPLMPKWVNSISPCSSKMALPSSSRVRVTFFSARPIIFLQSGSRLTRLTRLGTGSTRVCPACCASR